MSGTKKIYEQSHPSNQEIYKQVTVLEEKINLLSSRMDVVEELNESQNEMIGNIKETVDKQEVRLGDLHRYNQHEKYNFIYFFIVTLVFIVITLKIFI